MQLAEVLKAYNGLPPDLQKTVLAEALAATKHQRWVPNPGPQTTCYECEADETLFGGEPGGGKSQVLIGLALGPHERALLLRRTNKEAGKFVGEIEDIVGNRDGFNGQRDEWKIDGRHIDIGGCQHEDDKQKYKGDPHDLIGFDELSDFSESQYTFIGMWNRSTKPGQRCRIVGATNGPTTAEGMWIVRRWAPWLDPSHPNPAMSGEIRWYYTDDEGHEIEDIGPNTHVVLGRVVKSRSRTFIRSKLEDNPDLAATDYGSHLMAQSKDQRQAYALGDFGTMLEDKPNQCIPTAWVMAAVARWTPQPPVGIPMCAIGCDIACGGKDENILAPRHDAWFAKLIAKPGKETKKGTEGAGFVIAHRRDNAKVVVDLGGGWGGDVLAHLVANQIDAVGYMGVKKSNKRSRDLRHALRNVRTEAYWKFREALNPDQPGGSMVALPDDRMLIADLTAPTFDINGSAIELQPKDELVKSLGRSPDRGDAVVMSWWAGARMATDWDNWPAKHGGRTHQPQVQMGRKPITGRK